MIDSKGELASGERPQMGGSTISRRTLVRMGGGGIGATLLSGLLDRTAAGAAAVSEFTASTEPTQDLALEEIQGNILGGFKKDHQALLFFSLPNAGGRQWLTQLLPHVATASEVSSFNDLFRRAAAAGRSPASIPKTTWLNVALTFRGLAQLKVPATDLHAFPDDFAQGMKARAGILGDVGPNSPGGWVGPFGSPAMHGVLLIASDDAETLRAEVDAQRSAMTSAGVKVILDQRGAVRADEPGHEHFGFKDGISQPGIRGFTAPNNPADPNQGDPGQDLLWPGEFVVGYPTQRASPEPGTDENHLPGPISASGPAWTVNGSYLVFRRLRQDVAGFRNFVEATAAKQGLSSDLLGAKLVGRYRSGAPLECPANRPDIKPGGADPSLSDPSILEATTVNNFEFGDDPDGSVVPRAAHIRKVYPRDQVGPTGPEAATQTHRIIRRGIPYGTSYDPAAPATSPAGSTADFPNDRGLLFLCYQSSISRQFEFIQRRWVNDPDFPEPGDGQDPIISQAAPRRTFELAGGRPSHIELMQRFVTTTGGEYFFQPSISSLRLLSTGQ